MLAVFLALMLAANAALAGLTLAYPDLPIPASMGAILAMVAALSAGQTGTKAVDRRLVFKEKAVFAVLATALSLALSIAAYWVIFAYEGVPFTLENVVLLMTGDVVPAYEIRQILSWVLPVVLLVYLVVTYFGVGIGSRNQLKLQEKLAAKGR
jgi:hypothetical protein